MTTATQETERDRLIRRRIGRAISRARLALFWERLWPRLVPPFSVVGLFALISWFGFWPGLPDWLRYATLAFFSLAGLASLYPLLGLRWPSRADALARVENQTGAPHRPATGFFDKLAGANPDPATRAIWEAHRARLVAGFATLKSGTPSPGLPRRDPYGLRFLLLILLVVAFVFAGGRFDRLTDPFRGGGAAALAETGAAVRIDAWATPPDYTGRPSILLTADLANRDGADIAVPQGTEIIIRIAGDEAGTMMVAATASAVVEQPRLAEGPREYRVSVGEDLAVSVGTDGDPVRSWSFDVIPDMAPTIAITGGPERASGGGLQVGYAFADDYGVTDAWGVFTLAAPVPGAQPLVDAPALALVIPRSDPRQGEAVTVRDLSSHPWAGLDVDLTLAAADAIGQIGLSDTRTLVLPGRLFTNPLAQQLISQRQALALDSRQADNVALAVGRLSEWPETLQDLGTFLAMRSAYYRIRNARNEDELRAFLDYLWEIAIAIEANPLADAAAELQAAADALREALERGASDAEIAELTENLRAAMQQYMQTALSSGAMQGQARPAEAIETEVIRPDDLEGMLEEMEEFAQTGNRAAAEQLLNQIERMMQNLELTNIDGMQREMQLGQEQLDDLGFLMQQQQQLMDETFELQQQQNAPIGNPRTEEEAAALLEELAERRAELQQRADELARQQRQIQAQLGQLMERMAGNGEEMFELPDAERNMAEAGERIVEGQLGPAVNDQAEALAQMQATAEALAEQMAEGGNGPQINPDGQPPQDPFGRTPPLQGDRFGDNVEVPTEIDRQTARQILEVIRQRLEERGRPQIELDYLERLIELY